MTTRSDLVALLRHIVELYAPFVDRPSREALRWNGDRYRHISEGEADAARWDPDAAAWSATLRTMADMLELQTGELSEAQASYLRSVLCGGMGSFQDFSLDPGDGGEEARQVNARVDAFREHLFRLLSGRG